MSFNIPIYKLKAYSGALKKPKKEAPRPPERLHMKRSPAQLVVDAKFGEEKELIPSSIVLNEVTPHGVFLFTAAALPVGTQVTLVIDQPITFYIHGKVAFCKMLSLSRRIISETFFPNRVGIVFEYRTPEEREAVVRYCAELERGILSSSSSLISN